MLDWLSKYYYENSKENTETTRKKERIGNQEVKQEMIRPTHFVIL